MSNDDDPQTPQPQEPATPAPPDLIHQDHQDEMWTGESNHAGVDERDASEDTQRRGLAKDGSHDVVTRRR